MKKPSPSAPTRHGERFLSHRPAQLAENAAILLDVSESGARLRSSGKLKKGEKVQFRWRPVPGGPLLTLESEILWSDRELAGIHFLSLSARERAFLRALVRFHRS